MKKYLFTSAAALAFCGLFTSCTHDLGSEGSSAQNSVVKTYEQAFVTAFGQPDPNQEWGFGTSVASTRAMTRYANMPSKPTFRDGVKQGDEIVPPITKPTKPTFNVSAFEDKTDQQFNVSSGGSYKVNSGSSIGEMNNNGCNLYVVTDMTLTTFSAHGTNIIVAAGKKLTLGSMNQHVNIYLEEGAELDVSGISYTDWSDWQNPKTISGVIFDNNNTVSNIANLYLSKNSKVTGVNITFKNGYKVLNEGGFITTTNLTVYDSSASHSTLWNEGTVTTTGNLSCENEHAYIYNANNNKISVSGNLSLINNYDILYNDGTVSISGNITMTNSSAEIVNNDSLICSGNLDMTAGGKFHNVGDATITGTTYVYNTNSVWMNDGHFTTGTFSDQNCEQVYNNCYMTVTGTFHLGQPAASNGHSFFVLDGGEGDDVSGAYVKCANFIYGGNTDLFLGNKSFIEVTTEFKSANYNKGFGIHGPASGSYAVIKAPKVTKEGNPEESIAYDGKLYIDTPLHFEGGYTYSSSVQFSFKDEKSPVKIPKTDCNPGYGKDPEPEPSSDIIRVICEDLSVTQASDWDFNDAVFDVQLLDENKKVKITLLAAGGTLPLTVAGEEVHGKFQEFNPNLGISTGTMLSTGSTNSTGKYHYINCEIPYYIIDNIFGSTEIKEVAKAIPVQVQKLVNGEKTWVNIEWKKGAPTAKMAVGTDYNWCDERTDIRDNFRATNRGNEYPTFNMYVQGILEDDWYTKNTVNDGQAEAYIE